MGAELLNGIGQSIANHVIDLCSLIRRELGHSAHVNGIHIFGHESGQVGRSVVKVNIDGNVVHVILDRHVPVVDGGLNEAKCSTVRKDIVNAGGTRASGPTVPVFVSAIGRRVGIGEAFGDVAPSIVRHLDEEGGQV